MECDLEIVDEANQPCQEEPKGEASGVDAESLKEMHLPTNKPVGDFFRCADAAAATLSGVAIDIHGCGRTCIEDD